MVEKKIKIANFKKQTHKTKLKITNLFKPLYIIGIITIIILIYFLINSINKFWIDNLIAIALIIFILFFYERFHLNWFGLLLISIFLIIHNLGSFGIYSQPFYEFEWDKLVHFYYGLAGGVIAFIYFSNTSGKKSLTSIIIYSIFFIMAISVFHEIGEYLGATILGPGDGVLFFGAGDTNPGDTEWDLIYGFLGVFLSTVVTGIVYKIKNDQNKNQRKTLKRSR